MAKLDLHRLLVLLTACFMAVALCVATEDRLVDSQISENQAKDPTPQQPSDTSDNDNQNDDDEEEHLELLQETVSASRGARDEVGVRDQWSSDEHLKTVYDSRRPPSDKVLALLQQYRLDCEGCDHVQAVAKLNAFVAESKRYAAEQEAQRLAREKRSWWTKHVLVACVAGVLGLGWWYLTNDNGSIQGGGGGSGGYSLGGNSATAAGQQDRFLQDRRQRAAAAAQQRMAQNNQITASNKDGAPHEEDTWTIEQKQQFTDSLESIDEDVPPIVRYRLLAERVGGKTPKQCQAYHEQHQRQQQLETN